MSLCRNNGICFLFLRFARRSLLKALKLEPLQMFRMPTIDEASSYQNAEGSFKNGEVKIGIGDF